MEEYEKDYVTAARAVGAGEATVYVRGEYPLAVKRLDKAIKQAERMGLLGSRIFDSNFNFRVDIRIGAGAFVCGEETALMASVEGRRGQPRPRPPFPAESGLFGHPTLEVFHLLSEDDGATFSVAGTYWLRLTARDGHHA